MEPEQLGRRTAWLHEGRKIAAGCISCTEPSYVRTCFDKRAVDIEFRLTASLPVEDLFADGSPPLSGRATA